MSVNMLGIICNFINSLGIKTNCKSKLQDIIYINIFYYFEKMFSFIHWRLDITALSQLDAFLPSFSSFLIAILFLGERLCNMVPKLISFK